MLDFKAAIATAAPTRRSGWIDRDYMLRYIAVDRVIDQRRRRLSLVVLRRGQGNNPEASATTTTTGTRPEHANRFWLMPWDLDSSFDGSSFVHVSPEWTEPGPCECANGFAQRAPVVRPADLTLESWHDDYLAMTDAFIEGPFAAAKVNTKLDAWSRRSMPRWPKPPE